MTIYLIKYDISSDFLTCTWFGETHRFSSKIPFVQNHSVKLILVSFDLARYALSNELLFVYSNFWPQNFQISGVCNLAIWSLISLILSLAPSWFELSPQISPKFLISSFYPEFDLVEI